MGWLNEAIAWITSHGTLIFGILWGLCEALAALPFVKSNSVFQLIYNWIKKMKPSDASESAPTPSPPAAS